MYRMSRNTLGLLASLGDRDAAVAHQTWMELLEHQDPPYVVGCYYLRTPLNPTGTYHVGLMYDPNCDPKQESDLPIVLAQVGHHLTPIVRQRQRTTV